MLRQDAGVGDFIVKARVHGVVMTSRVSMCQSTESEKQVAAGKDHEGFHLKGYE
jgi:hypothetical protein